MSKLDDRCGLTGWSAVRIAAPLLLVIIFVTATYARGLDSYLQSSDFLDQWPGFYAVLSFSDLFAPYGTILPFAMGGFPREGLVSEFLVPTLLHVSLGLLPAAIILDLLTRLVAFAGLLLLLTRHLEVTDRSVATGVALCFAFLPFRPYIYLTISAMPLLLHAALNIFHAQNKWHDWVVLALYPFFSSLVLGGYAIVGALGCLAFYLWITGRQVCSWRLLAPVLLLILLFIIVEWRLFYQFFVDAGYTSHRTEFRAYDEPLYKPLRRVGRMALFGHYHTPSLHTYIILPVCTLGLGLMIHTKRLQPLVPFLLASVLGITAFFGIYSSSVMIPLKTMVPLLNQFQFNRLYYLLPVIWFILFGLCLSFLWQSAKSLPALRRVASGLLAAIFAGQISISVYHSQALAQKREHGLTVRQFFAPEIFAQIDRHIGLPKESYRVLTIGLHPSVPLYNGFYTIGGYLANYPLSYKHRFRALIAGELERSERWRRYFDGWGCRVYAFPSEVEKMDYNRPQDFDGPYNAYIDTAVLRELGGEFVISRWPIKNATPLELDFQERFSAEGIPYPLHLYRVGPSAGLGGG